MKTSIKILLISVGLLFCSTLTIAQTSPATMVTTPSASLQSFGTYGMQYWDSVTVTNAQATTIPSGYFEVTHYMHMSAAVKYTGVVTLPVTPFKGQIVSIISDKAFYHLFTTVPACIVNDTAGSQKAVLVFDGKNWHMTN